MGDEPGWVEFRSLLPDDLMTGFVFMHLRTPSYDDDRGS